LKFAINFTPLSPRQAHLAQTICRIETSTRPLAYNLKDESDQNPYHIDFNKLKQMLKRGTMVPTNYFFNLPPNRFETRKLPTTITHSPKFLAHDEKHKFPCCVVVLQSFNEKKLEVGRAAFRTPPSTPPGRLLSPPCSHTNPHKVSV